MQGPRLLETTIGEIFQDIEKGKILHDQITGNQSKARMCHIH